MAEKQCNLIFGGGMKEVINLMYPIGQTIIRDHNPADDYPWQTWKQDCVDRFPVGAGNKYQIDQTGGEENHTLTINEMPSHNHAEIIGDGSSPQNLNPLRRVVPSGVEGGGKIRTDWELDLGEVVTTASTGGSQPHNNMPPYQGVYFWTRTA
jgi:hypothetical protein